MRRLVATLLLALAALSIQAHESMPASLTLTQLEGQLFAADFRLPATQGAAPNITPRFPAACSIEQGPIEQAAPGALLRHWRLRCEDQLAEGARIVIDGLPATMINTLVQLDLRDGRHWSHLASPRSPVVLLGTLQAAQVDAGSYFKLGIEHILTGFDHLLFVLCLILIVASLRTLLLTITAFTLAHSITLALATLGVLQVPQAPVEASIALSIIVLARELLLPANGNTVVMRWPWLVAFGFGLLHGLGFAGVMSEVGLPAGQVPQALLLFNLGVEAGQLAFVLVVSLLMAVLRTQAGAWLLPSWRVCAYGVGTTAAYWMLQRVATIVA